jgi:hypothetical protein
VLHSSFDSAKGSISVQIRSGTRDLLSPRAPAPIPNGRPQFVQDVPVAYRNLNSRRNVPQRPNNLPNGFHPYATSRAMYHRSTMPLARSTASQAVQGGRHQNQTSQPNLQLHDYVTIGRHPAPDRQAYTPANAPIPDAIGIPPDRRISNSDSDPDSDSNSPHLLEKQKALKDLILSLPEKYRLTSVDLEWHDGPIRAAAHVIGYGYSVAPLMSF